jgi:hypothetical protein
VAQEDNLPLDEYHRAGVEIVNGNPEVYKTIYSRRDDVTLANPFGPPARGWSQVSSTLDHAASNFGCPAPAVSSSLGRDRRDSKAAMPWPARVFRIDP